jgi:hypothetical protein
MKFISSVRVRFDSSEISTDRRRAIGTFGENEQMSRHQFPHPDAGRGTNSLRIRARGCHSLWSSVIGSNHEKYVKIAGFAISRAAYWLERPRHSALKLRESERENCGKLSEMSIFVTRTCGQKRRNEAEVGVLSKISPRESR